VAYDVQCEEIRERLGGENVILAVPRCARGSNNPAEQQHAKHLKDSRQNPFKFVYAWVAEVSKVEGEIVRAAQELKDEDAILTPWANSIKMRRTEW